MNFVKTNVSQAPIELLPMSCDECLTGCENIFEEIEEANGFNNTAGEKADEEKLFS